MVSMQGEILSDRPSFEISAVSRILNMPFTRVKNWTIGRPLAIKPSVRRAKGKGKSNLYAPEEVFLMAVANHLVNDGLGLDVVEEVVRKLTKLESSGDVRYLLVYRESKGRSFEVKRVQTLTNTCDLPILLSEKTGPASAYVLDLKRLRELVSASITEEWFWEQVTPGVKLTKKQAAETWPEEEE
jgi:hypothetical protein